MKCRNYAHRGFSGKYPENTMIAFEKAIEAGCEGIEFDVHLTKDNRLVIIHDESIERTSGVSGLVKDMTFDELSQIDFSYKYKGQVPPQKIPLLSDYFELVTGLNIVSNIELKTGIYEYPGIEEAVYEMAKHYCMLDNIIVSSFNHNSVMRMKAIDPDVRCGFLSETWILDTAEYVRSCGIEAYHPEFHMLTDSETEKLQKKGIEINTFTVNTSDDINHMIDLGIDGIISNHPDLVKSILNERGLR